MIAERLSAAPTLVSPLEFACALARCWAEQGGELPGDTTVRLLTAQSILETGWWEHCRAFNLGNIKSVPGDGRSWCFFACNEILTWKDAERLIAAAPPRSDGQGPSAAIDHEATSRRTAKLGKDDGRCVVQFWPDHPACRFRAFASLDDGMRDHLAFLRGLARFAAAMAAAARGDIPGFVRGLKAGGYFTADEAAYLETLAGVLGMLGPLPWREVLLRQAADAAATTAYLEPIPFESNPNRGE